VCVCVCVCANRSQNQVHPNIRNWYAVELHLSGRWFSGWPIILIA